jgi:hypothetical protein
MLLLNYPDKPLLTLYIIFLMLKPYFVSISPYEWCHPSSSPIGTVVSFVKRPGREADQSPPSSAKVKNAWSYTSTLQYALMSWCSVKQHRDNFTFYHMYDVVHISVLEVNISNLWLRGAIPPLPLYIFMAQRQLTFTLPGIFLSSTEVFKRNSVVH